LTVSYSTLIGLTRTGFAALTLGSLLRFSDLPRGSSSTIGTSSFHALKIAFITDFSGEALISALGGDSRLTFVMLTFYSSTSADFLPRLPVVSIFIWLIGDIDLFADAIAFAGVFADVFNAASVTIFGSLAELFRAVDLATLFFSVVFTTLACCSICLVGEIRDWRGLAGFLGDGLYTSRLS
jgi:hypothetical protein